MTDRGLQDEIKKRNPFDCPEQEVALNLSRTVDRFHADFARLFKTQGITGAQYNVLRILRGAGDRLACQEIASRMINHLPDITRLVDRLENAGLVERSRPLDDRRVVLTAITSQGLALLERLDGPVLELHRNHLGHLTSSELEELNRLLVKARCPDEPGDSPPPAPVRPT